MIFSPFKFLMLGVVIGILITTPISLLLRSDKKQTVIEVKTGKVISEKIYRDYSNMDVTQLTEMLFCFDKSIPLQELTREDDGKFILHGQLCERTWKQEIDIKNISNEKKNKIIFNLGIEMIDNRLYIKYQAMYFRRLFAIKRFDVSFGGGFGFTQVSKEFLAGAMVSF
jgi:hypothetical protein